MKLSIITINYNNLSGLQKTMDSVFAQTCQDFEYIVIDGASTDGSAEYIKNHSNKLTYWVSEKDTGIYNAMNKGVRAAKGEYVLMLNSGDYLVDENVVERVEMTLDGTDIIQGNTIDYVHGHLVVNRGYGKSNINFIDVQQGHFLHQASFCRRELFEKYGYFDESYKIDGDTVFYIRCLGRGNATFKYVDLNIAYFESGGMSDNHNEKWKLQREKEFKRWSTEEFSQRQWNTCVEYDKKGRVYDLLHSSKCSWMITMLLIKLLCIFK